MKVLIVIWSVLITIGLLALTYLIGYAFLSAVSINTNTATIISGLLSLVGGATGALGAYFVATYQMKKQLEHEKKNDEKKKLEQMELFLIKVMKLNNRIMEYINIFSKEFSGEYIEKNIVYKLKVREHDFIWLIKRIESINDEFLKEEYNSEYFDFIGGVQNLYSVFIAYKYSPDQSQYLIEFRKALNERLEGFISFDTYLKEQIEIIKTQK